MVSCECMQLGKRQHRKTNQLCKSHFLGQCTIQHSAQQMRKIDRSENKSYARRTINLIIDFCEVKVKSGIFFVLSYIFFSHMCVSVCVRVQQSKQRRTTDMHMSKHSSWHSSQLPSNKERSVTAKNEQIEAYTHT